MAEITRAGVVNGSGLYYGGPSIATLDPPTICYHDSFKAYGPLNPGDFVFLNSSNLWQQGIVDLNAAPSTAPVPTASATTSTFVAGTYYVSYTLVTAYGESTPSPLAAVTLTATQSISVAAIGGAALNASITSLNIYVNGMLFANSTVTSGTSAVTVISALPATGAIPPPTANSAFKDNYYQVRGWVDQQVFAANEAVAVKSQLLVNYGGLTAGKEYYLSTAVAGGITDVRATPALPALGYAYDANRLWVYGFVKY